MRRAGDTETPPASFTDRRHYLGRDMSGRLESAVRGVASFGLNGWIFYITGGEVTQTTTTMPPPRYPSSLGKVLDASAEPGGDT